MERYDIPVHYASATGDDLAAFGAMLAACQPRKSFGVNLARSLNHWDNVNRKDMQVVIVGAQLESQSVTTENPYVSEQRPMPRFGVTCMKYIKSRYCSKSARQMNDLPSRGSISPRPTVALCLRPTARYAANSSPPNLPEHLHEMSSSMARHPSPYTTTRNLSINVCIGQRQP